eukprot:10791354-Prorocentrum_lima.AAC.1
MTSSLVGSEMCIRDRPRGPPDRTRGNNAEHRAALRQRNLKGWEALQALETVSYTHLTLPTICSV